MERFDDDERRLEQRADEFFRALERDTDAFVDPLVPSEVRRLGDRRRRRRHTAVAASTLGLGVVAAAGAFGLSGMFHHDGDTPQTAAQPTASSTPTSRQSLPTEVPNQSASPAPTTAETVTTPSAAPTPSVATSSPASTPTSTPSGILPASESPTPGPASDATPSTPATATSASTSPSPDAQAPVSWDNVAGASLVPGGLTQSDRAEGSRVNGMSMSHCQESFSGLDASTMKLRYLYGPKYSATVIVFDFSSADKASAARGIIRSWFTQCRAKLTSLGYTNVTVTPAQELTPQNAVTPAQISYRTLTDTDTTGQQNYQQHLLLQSGQRIEWVQYVTSGSAATKAAPTTTPDEMPGTQNAQQMLAQLEK